MLGHTLTTTDITLEGMRSEGRRWCGGKTRGTSPNEPEDRGLLVEGSAT